MTTNTRKKSAQDYADSLNFKQTIKKIKSHQEYYALDDPYDLSERFSNL